jgi:hypothetical protein
MSNEFYLPAQPSRDDIMALANWLSDSAHRLKIEFDGHIWSVTWRSCSHNGWGPAFTMHENLVNDYKVNTYGDCLVFRGGEWRNAMPSEAL